jgi:hypothetical protein
MHKTLTMKSSLLILLFAIPVAAKCQSASGSASIPLPIYDTLSIDIKSTNSFYFGKKLYAIPRQCEDTIQVQSNCCSYDAQITKWSAHHTSSQISCFDGTSLRWTLFDTEKKGKDYYESYQDQLSKQMKSFNQADIRLLVCDKAVTAKRLSFTTHDGHTVHELIFYGTINGEVLVGHVSFLNNVRSAKELTPFFQQFLQF